MHKESEKWILRIIPPLYRDCKIDNFQGSKIKAYAQNFIDQYPASPHLVFSGPTGNGKTHLACAIYRGLIADGKLQSDSAKFVTAPELLLEIRKVFNNQGGTEDEILKKYSDCDFLILDDLGSEKTSEFAIQALYLLIDRRIRNIKPTIITTNLSIEKIEEKLDSRIASRLSSMRILKTNLPDYRKRRK